MKPFRSSGKPPVGGGVKKILYALRTIQRIGLLDSGKALTANNTCKACGLGMGGQRGGMTNELGEFPAVCNKSVQAQSTDIQPPIPAEIFDYTLQDFQALSAHELEHLGRLGNPIFKAANSHRFEVVDWSWALQQAVRRFSDATPERTFFYSSGRSSNEAGFVLQLLARLYGTNNVNNCSYYCHQATSVGLGNTIGTGTATIELADLDQADCIFVIGANPASNHPRFIHKLKACRDRDGTVVVINPAREPGLVRFALPKSPTSLMQGGSDIASHYLQPLIGSDTLLLKAIAKVVVEQGATDPAFIKHHTTGFEHYAEDVQQISWHDIERQTAVSRADIEAVANVYTRSRNAVFSWGMGVTHHTHGVGNVEAIASLALLRGMIARPGAGLLPLRGHSNVQGIGTVGVKPVLSPAVREAMQTSLNVELPAYSASPGLDTLSCLRRAYDGEMEAALMMGGNLYSATPHTAWAATALDRIGFKLFLTTTLNAGHVHTCDNSDALILPVLARDEEVEPTTQESMFNYVRLSDGGIQRIAQARSEVSVLVELGQGILKKAGVEQAEIDFCRFQRHDTVRDTIAEVVPGMDRLRNINRSKAEFHIPGRVLHQPQFNTGSGKAHFVVVPNPKMSEQGAFMLTSVRSEGQFNSIVYEEHDSYRGVSHRWVVFMNPEDIRDLALSEDDCVNIHSDSGSMHDVHPIPYDVPLNNAMVYYPEANCLVGLEQDPRSKTPAFKSVRVRIEKST